MTFSWFLIKQPNIKHITQKRAGEPRWSSASSPCKGIPEQMHQAPRMATWGRGGVPSLGKGSDSCSWPPEAASSHSSALRAIPASASLLPGPGLCRITLSLTQEESGRAPPPGTRPPQSSHPVLLPRCHGPSAQGISGVSSCSWALPSALLKSLPAARRLFFESGGGGEGGTDAFCFALPTKVLTFPGHLHKTAEGLSVDTILGPFCA